MSAELPGRNDQTPPANVESIACPSCERKLPGSVLYCPYCCGDDGRSGALARGAFIGGIFGLLAGGLATVLWSNIVGQTQATWGPVLAITLGGGGAGMLIGVIVNRKR
ncbi:MAG TPA: hypothetical protein PLF25_06500 [Accumulibacter sp.]|nr:hypothetical protein [Accumulibacter sp.]